MLVRREGDGRSRRPHRRILTQTHGGRALTAKTGALHKFGMIVAVLLASSGAGFLLAQQRDWEQSQSAEKAAETPYQACLSSASATHDASWAAACKRLAEKTQQDRADCLSKLNLPKTYCNASYPPRDGSANCTLPDEIATLLDAALAQARYGCVRQREGTAQ